MTDQQYTEYMRQEAEKHGFGLKEVGYDPDRQRVVMNFGHYYCLMHADKALETGRALIQMAAMLKGENN